MLFDKNKMIEDTLKPLYKELEEIESALKMLPPTINSNSVIKTIGGDPKEVTFLKKEKTKEIKELNVVISVFTYIFAGPVYKTKNLPAGYFVWVDVPYQMIVNEWKISDWKYNESNFIILKGIADENLTKANDRKKEIQNQICLFQKEIEDNKMIIRKLLEKLKVNKTGGELVSPDVLIDAVDAEIDRLDNSKLSDIFKLDWLKDRIIENLAWLAKKKKDKVAELLKEQVETKTYDDIMGETQFKTKLNSRRNSIQDETQRRVLSVQKR